MSGQIFSEPESENVIGESQTCVEGNHSECPLSGCNCWCHDQQSTDR